MSRYKEYETRLHNKKDDAVRLENEIRGFTSSLGRKRFESAVEEILNVLSKYELDNLPRTRTEFLECVRDITNL